MKLQTVKTECVSCNGTGIYIGLAEPKGTAVICLVCGGSGCQTINYKPFTRRKGRRGIHTVQLSRGSFIPAGVGPVGCSITYKEFKQGKIPS